MNTIIQTRPGLVGRLRSRQSGPPTDLLERFFGRAMEGTTAGSNDRALAVLDFSEPRTVLDVGFGQGRTASVLIRDGPLVIGVDASPTMVEQATARNRAAYRDGRATLRHGDGITIAFADQTADAAIIVHTIYFMPDPPATLTEIARVLRPDVYRIPSAGRVIDMLHAAGFNQVEHLPGDASNRDIHRHRSLEQARTPFSRLHRRGATR